MIVAPAPKPSARPAFFRGRGGRGLQSATPCQNDGVCIDGVASYTCECKPGCWRQL
jgi:hypothetical protein